MDNTPCRVTAELNAHESAINHAEQQVFDIYDDDLMHDVMGNKRLAEPVQDLLIFRDEIRVAAGSFGVDYSRVYESLIKKLDKLYENVKEQWVEDC